MTALSFASAGDGVDGGTSGKGPPFIGNGVASCMSVGLEDVGMAGGGSGAIPSCPVSSKTGGHMLSFLILPFLTIAFPFATLSFPFAWFMLMSRSGALLTSPRTRARCVLVVPPSQCEPP